MYTLLKHVYTFKFSLCFFFGFSVFEVSFAISVRCQKNAFFSQGKKRVYFTPFPQLLQIKFVGEKIVKNINLKDRAREN